MIYHQEPVAQVLKRPVQRALFMFSFVPFIASISFSMLMVVRGLTMTDVTSKEVGKGI